MVVYFSGNILFVEKDELMGWVVDLFQGQEFFDKVVILWSVMEEMVYFDFLKGKVQVWDKVVGCLDSLIVVIGGGVKVC